MVVYAFLNCRKSPIGGFVRGETISVKLFCGEREMDKLVSYAHVLSGGKLAMSRGSEKV